MDCAFPDLVWARLRILEGGTAEVLDSDGRVHSFDTLDDARLFLREDEFVSLADLDEDDVKDLGFDPRTLHPDGPAG